MCVFFPSRTHLSYTDSEVFAFNFAIDSLSARSEQKNCFLSYDSDCSNRMCEGVCICAYMLEQETKRKEAEMVYKYNRT